MTQIIDFFISQYQSYPNYLIAFEIIAVILGIASVLFAKQENIWVYPTGIISTALYVYILWKFSLYGDMLVNAYYTLMSIYGWYIWSKPKLEHQPELKITRLDSIKDWSITIGLFLLTIGIVTLIYTHYDAFKSWANYVDLVVTGIFFSAMWLMARKKIENWILWIVGDIISIPMYCYKGLGFTAFQYAVFTVLAIMAYVEWRKRMNENTRLE